MYDVLLFALRLATALACGLMGGLFFVFSNTVMGALGRLQPAEGIAAMQSINRVILNPLFLTIFLATPAACALVVLTSLWRWSEPGAAWLIAGSALYIVGTFLVTIALQRPHEQRARRRPSHHRRGRRAVDALPRRLDRLEPRPHRRLPRRRRPSHHRPLSQRERRISGLTTATQAAEPLLAGAALGEGGALFARGSRKCAPRSTVALRPMLPRWRASHFSVSLRPASKR